MGTVTDGRRTAQQFVTMSVVKSEMASCPLVAVSTFGWTKTNQHVSVKTSEADGAARVDVSERTVTTNHNDPKKCVQAVIKRRY